MRAEAGIGGRPMDWRPGVTDTEPVRVTVVTAPACHFCDDAQAALAGLAQVYPLAVRLVAADSSDGQVLLHRHGAGTLRALVVDDEEHLARLVADYLAREGFAAEVALDGERALELARAQHPDVVILDLMLPGTDGVEVCRKLRTFTDAYVIMLTARAEEVDKLIGLAVGADDYLTKPFSPRELVARVKTMLRRPRSPLPTGADASARRFGDLTIDAAAREVSVAGTLVDLTRLEFDLLDVLSARPRVAFSRRQLVERVWGEDWFGDEHIVDVHIVRLRRKLGDDAASPRYVRTVRGVGYRMGPGT
jgi:DNA-binding response OmpR family regulator